MTGLDWIVGALLATGGLGALVSLAVADELIAAPGSARRRRREERDARHAKLWRTVIRPRRPRENAVDRELRERYGVRRASSDARCRAGLCDCEVYELKDGTGSIVSVRHIPRPDPTRVTRR